MRLRYQWIVSIALALSLCFLANRIIPATFANQTPIDPNNLSDDSDSSENIALFDNNPQSVPHQQLFIPSSNTLGDSDNQAEKRIEVDLTHQRLYAYQGNELVHNFVISSGKWDRTPTGTFRIWAKILSTKMEGGSKLLNTYYYLPRVPYVMFFSNDKVAKSQGYSLHGTYWHDNFGVPMSHGCINMKTEDAGILYQWALPSLNSQKSIFASANNPGTPITIYGKYQP